MTKKELRHKQFKLRDKKGIASYTAASDMKTTVCRLELIPC